MEREQGSTRSLRNDTGSLELPYAPTIRDPAGFVQLGNPAQLS